ncbi:PRELI domain containing protein 3A isoform X4 [Suncus etruscus]|uniref:PRELI domain containing protein 3A isoform X4 n=1 Tax=Suncus etruscus TaxID=109475 RepID=UPI00210FB26A|nr:PRELI domain containing protein 3A isoform X4 [Suncus etruscus]
MPLVSLKQWISGDAQKLVALSLLQPPMGHGHQGRHAKVPEPHEPLCRGSGCAGAECGWSWPAAQPPAPQHRVGPARLLESDYGNQQDFDVHQRTFCCGSSRKENGTVLHQYHTHKLGVCEREIGLYPSPGEPRNDEAHTGSHHHCDWDQPWQLSGKPNGQHDIIQCKEGS